MNLIKELPFIVSRSQASKLKNQRFPAQSLLKLKYYQLVTEAKKYLRQQLFCDDLFILKNFGHTLNLLGFLFELRWLR